MAFQTAALAQPAQPEGAAPAAPFSASQTVIVTTDKAEAFAGNESIGRIPPGMVLRYSREKGNWLMIPRQSGWVRKDYVVPVETAVEHFSQIIATQPNPQAYQHRGIAHSERGEFDAAIADFDKALAGGLKQPSVYVNRGVAKQRKGDVTGAVADYTEAIKLAPLDPLAYDNRASALAALEQYDASLADSDKAIEISPRFPEAYNNRGVTWQFKGDFARAAADFSQALEIYPRYAAALANRGYARKKQGQVAEAIADYEEAIVLDPQLATAHNDLAWILATSSDDAVRNAERAVELAERACNLSDRKVGEYLDTLAAAQAAKGDFAAAIASSEAALSSAREGAKPDIAARLELYRAEKPYRE